METSPAASSVEGRRRDCRPGLFGLALFFLALLRMGAPDRASANARTLVDLSPPGPSLSHATAINEVGQVCGWWETSAEKHAFLWSPEVPNGVVGTYSDLGLTGYSQALGINAAGQVAGWTTDEPGCPAHAFLWTPQVPNGPDGTLSDLPSPGVRSIATAVNDEGQVIGFWEDRGNAGSGFLWTPDTPNGRTGVVTDLAPARGVRVYPSAINNEGQVVGRAKKPEHTAQAFVWTPESPNGDRGRLVCFRPFGGSHGEASTINDHGEIAGTYVGHDGALRAYRCSAGKVGTAGFVDLSAGAGGLARANGISPRGEVVGWTDTLRGDTCATLFLAGSGDGRCAPAGAAPQLLCPRGDRSSEACAINTAGQVVGVWQDITGREHAALWQPRL